MGKKLIYTIDFETKKILPRPRYPPEPVGVAIKEGNKRSRYYAWGHSTENNTTKDEIAKILHNIWALAQRGDAELLFHNAKFDVDVAETFLGCPRLPWDRYHDTLFLLFLDDPHAISLSLKPSSERLLGLPPDEQDAVKEWLLANYTVNGQKLSISPDNKKGLFWAGYISEAPGKLVGTYAVGDVDRTKKLFDFLFNNVVVKRSMGEAYDRERRLMPHLLDNERQGAKVDVDRLRADIEVGETALAHLENAMRKNLGVDDINFDSDADLAIAMFDKGILDRDKMAMTATGKYSMAKESVAAAVTDPVWIEALKYRAQMNTCLRTFMHNWATTAEKSGGLIFTSWNQVRQTADGGNMGARTGRLSSTPNLQNIPSHMSVNLKRLSKFYRGAAKQLIPLPRVRSYVVPWKKGWCIFDRDYSQQELRILGHYEEGDLLEQYCDNPWMDVHDYVLHMLHDRFGLGFKRPAVKTTNFGIIYGMGVPGLSKKTGLPPFPDSLTGLPKENAKALKDAVLKIFPGIKQLYQEMRERAMTGQPIRTWGGREYYCEPPRSIVDKRTGAKKVVTFDYKLVNVLIQGSAADCTKEAWIRMAETMPKDMRLYFTVHDSFVGSVLARRLSKIMKFTGQCLSSVNFDVPMLSEGKASMTSWGDCTDYDTKGVVVWKG